jgi:hypothetical protein
MLFFPLKSNSRIPVGLSCMEMATRSDCWADTGYLRGLVLLSRLSNRGRSMSVVFDGGFFVFSQTPQASKKENVRISNPQDFLDDADLQLRRGPNGFVRQFLPCPVRVLSVSGSLDSGTGRTSSHNTPLLDTCPRNQPKPANGAAKKNCRELARFFCSRAMPSTPVAPNWSNMKQKRDLPISPT